MKECEHCGWCCLSSIPCILGQSLFGITDDNPAPCPACECENGLYWCGLIRKPTKWFPGLVGRVDWKCEDMVDIARIYIGMGDGCGINPTPREIILRLKEYIGAIK